MCFIYTFLKKFGMCNIVSVWEKSLMKNHPNPILNIYRNKFKYIYRSILSYVRIYF